MTIILSIVFALGYAAIALEHPIKINKAATALLTGVAMWTIYALFAPPGAHISEQLGEHIIEISGILFFLLGAMTIVELIDAHDGFQVIVDSIRTDKARTFVLVIAVLAFFLSAVIDNLTTTIVMVSLLRKLVADRRERMLIIGLVVVAANAGGAWSPIGDVTTTMLWIGGQISVSSVITQTFLASVVCAAVPTAIVAYRMKGQLARPAVIPRNEHFTTDARERKLVLVLGIASLLFVPVFKTVTHLPPFMGMLFALGFLWVVTELIHAEKDEEEKGVLSVNHALRRADTPSVLFFLGILLSVGALQANGVLTFTAAWLDRTVGNLDAITMVMGFLSSIVDNVPLVAAVQGAYGLERFPMDDSFWTFLAYCAGTGGSALVIGSAAGVAAMGLEKIEFFWYVRNISWLALLGYLAGAAVFLMQRSLG